MCIIGIYVYTACSMPDVPLCLWRNVWCMVYILCMLFIYVACICLCDVYYCVHVYICDLYGVYMCICVCKCIVCCMT